MLHSLAGVWPYLFLLAFVLAFLTVVTQIRNIKDVLNFKIMDEFLSPSGSRKVIVRFLPVIVLGLGTSASFLGALIGLVAAFTHQ